VQIFDALNTQNNGRDLTTESFDRLRTRMLREHQTTASNANFIQSQAPTVARF
jgi:hypothetical protein